MPRSTSRPLPLHVDRCEYHLAIDHPALGRVQSDASIVHRLAYSPPHFFSQGPFLHFGLVHEFWLRTTAHGLVWSQWGKRWYREGGEPPDPTKAEEHELWAPLAPLGDVAPKSRRVYSGKRLLLAHVTICEVPYRLTQEIDDDLAEVFCDYPDLPEYAVIDTLRATDDGFSLRRPLQNGGSLLVVHDLEVHPAFAGQLLGARLLTHATWLLARHPGDLLYLMAYPWRRIFTRELRRPKASGREIARLVRYYERLGFHRAEPEIKITRSREVRMYRHVGAFGLPVDGLGWLSEWAGRARVEPFDL